MRTSISGAQMAWHAWIADVLASNAEQGGGCASYLQLLEKTLNL
jgi:hypothetical protein